MKKLIILSAAFLFANIYAQNKEIEVWPKDNMGAYDFYEIKYTEINQANETLIGIKKYDAEGHLVEHRQKAANQDNFEIIYASNSEISNTENLIKENAYNTSVNKSSASTHEISSEGVKTLAWDESDKNVNVKTISTQNAKGETRQYIYTYEKDSETLLSSVFYDYNGKVAYKALYDGSIDKPTRTIRYNNGKETIKREFTYQGDMLVTYHRYEKGNLQAMKVNTYDEKGLPMEQKIFNSKGSLVKQVYYNYNMYTALD